MSSVFSCIHKRKVKAHLSQGSIKFSRAVIKADSLIMGNTHMRIKQFSQLAAFSLTKKASVTHFFSLPSFSKV